MGTCVTVSGKPGGRPHHGPAMTARPLEGFDAPACDGRRALPRTQPPTQMVVLAPLVALELGRLSSTRSTVRAGGTNGPKTGGSCRQYSRLRLRTGSPSAQCGRRSVDGHRTADQPAQPGPQASTNHSRAGTRHPVIAIKAASSAIRPVETPSWAGSCSTVGRLPSLPRFKTIGAPRRRMCVEDQVALVAPGMGLVYSAKMFGVTVESTDQPERESC